MGGFEPIIYSWMIPIRSQMSNHITTIVSDKITRRIKENDFENYIPDNTFLKRWTEFSPNNIFADHLVLDLDLTEHIDDAELLDHPLNRMLGGKQRELAEVDHNIEPLLETFQDLKREDYVENYLDTGNNLTVIYSDLTKIDNGSRYRWTHSHSWLRKSQILARTIPLDEAKLRKKGIEEYEIVTKSQPIHDYFDYVDGYTHILDFDEMADENPESIALSTEDNVIAALISKYRDDSKNLRDINGQFILLPQPTRLHPKPQDLIDALVEIGQANDNKAKASNTDGQQTTGSVGGEMTQPDDSGEEKWDIFISHDSDDSQLADSIYSALEDRDIKCWLDDAVLELGDSLTQQIDHGLTNSDYAVIIVSENFVKNVGWASDEWEALRSRDAGEDEKVILPVWYNISKSEVMRYSPWLAEKIAISVSSSDEGEKVAEEVAQIITN
ncbi:toll/interleukin-1 receptor domain-containing protein [Natronosalvus vescus]|uniref:toll/interleukin-1 receptor domain-containing protein n=1 Tax=Natronosalvus vescus TaxID=2953881 RepID=UPI0020904C7A|nr:toll/interleukin-1 receptor domain-containing protein [Natronosalvus vescus]